MSDCWTWLQQHVSNTPELNIGRLQSIGRAEAWAGSGDRVTWWRPLGPGLSHQQLICVCVVCTSCGAARDEGRESATPTGRTGEQTSAAAAQQSLHHTDTQMISTTCSTTEMVTQGKLQISDSDNVEGKRLASLLSLFINMLVWAARLPNAPLPRIELI